MKVEFIHFSLAGSAQDAVTIQIYGFENASCGVVVVLGSVY